MSKALSNFDKINNNKARVATKIENFLENGRSEITTKDELDDFPIGSLISYMNKNNVFKSCGFLTKITSNYFVYIRPDFENKFRVRFKNVDKIWVGDVYHTKNDLVSIIKTKNNKTNFPVKINGIPVYYGKTNFDAKRFKNTQKFKLMEQWINYFDISSD